jgi:hypothetical protein
MSKLNRDVLYLILQELQDDKNSLHSCLLVNKTCCEIIIPILWKDPWKFLKNEKMKLLLNVIISHLSNESKKNLLNRGIDDFLLTNSYNKPLFNYISFCKHLNLTEIQRMVRIVIDTIYKKSKIKVIINELINLFINGNTNFTHLYIPKQLDYQIHGTEHCFSKIEFLSCNTSINSDVLAGLTEISKSIKELELYIESQHNNYEIIRLIETPKKLFNVRFLTNHSSYLKHDESFYEILENSLIKHANTLQYFKVTKQLTTKAPSSFINLKILELNGNSLDKWDCLKNISSPLLQILRARRVPVNVLTSLIKGTSGFLTEIKIDHVTHNEISNKKIIRAICQKCPNLKYLKLEIRDGNILELEKLLINCQYLNGLYFFINDMDYMDYMFNLDSLFEVLTKSSPNSLFKFKFNIYHWPIKLDSLKLFFDNWKGRRPMLLQFNKIKIIEEISDLIEKYKIEGVIKKYDNYLYGEDFEWIEKDF